MDGGALGGIFTLSIDLELDIDHQTEARRQRLDEIRALLISLLEQTGIPATWAVADPAVSAATDPILASRVGHEIAVLADRTWFGHGSGRLRLRRELSRRFDRARRLGIAVSTLVLRNVEEVSDFDLLVEQGVLAIRGPMTDTAPWGAASGDQPAAIWHLPQARRIPATSPWWLPKNWGAKRGIMQAWKRGLAVHLAIDTPVLIDEGERGLVLLGHLLGWLAALQAKGTVSAQTLGALGRAHLEAHPAPAAQTALRPAA